MFLASVRAESPVGFGLKVGAPLNDAYNATNLGIVLSSGLGSSGNVAPGGYSSGAKRFLVGPMVELRLPFSVSIEADALYQSVGFRRLQAFSMVPQPSIGAANIDASAWEFPVLLKYKFKGIPLVKPYLGAGLSFKRITGIDNLVELANKTSTGVVLEGGLEFKLLLLRISPEVRYTGYTVSSFTSPNGLLQTNKNQLAVLVGFSF